MRIAYVCADLGIPVFGRKGCSIHVQEMVGALQAERAQIDLFTMRPEGDPPPGLESVRVHALPLPPKGDTAAREQKALAVNDAIQAMLEAEGPYDLVYERYSLWSYAGMAYARAVGIPGLLEVNAPLIDEQVEHRTLIDRVGAERVAERVFSSASALVAVSEEVAACLRRYPGMGGRVHVVPNGVNPDRFSVHLRRCRTSADGFTVGFIGTLKPWHGLGVLVHAFAELATRTADARLLIVGDGPELPRLEADLAARGLRDRADLVGPVAPSEVPGLLATMDVGIAPYPKLPHFYFSPLKVYEYMAAALPVVASRVGQLATLIEHEVTGLLCPPGDVAALAATLERLRIDPGLRIRLGDAAREAVLREHTWRAVAQRVLGLAGLQAISVASSGSCDCR
jgi:glycosyltransferase involved in cell wall biosynthesis